MVKDKIRITVENDNISMIFEMHFDCEIEQIYSIFRLILQGLAFHQDTINEIMPIEDKCPV